MYEKQRRAGTELSLRMCFVTAKHHLIALRARLKRKTRPVNGGAGDQDSVWSAAKVLQVGAVPPCWPMQLSHTGLFAPRESLWRRFILFFSLFASPCKRATRVAFGMPPDMNIAFTPTPKHWHYLWRQSSSAVKWGLSADTEPLTSDGLFVFKAEARCEQIAAGIQSAH